MIDSPTIVEPRDGDVVVRASRSPEVQLSPDPPCRYAAIEWVRSN
jgi:hypothetical protein